MSSQPFLRLRGIRKEFGSFVALEGVDLEIERGEFVCFLGPSGCGKTTVLRIVAGLEPQTSGLVEQGGKDVSTLPAAMRDYGIVFQSYALFPNLSVADNVAYGLVNRKRPRAEIAARVAELLALVGLSGAQPKYPAQLSGGQQQRVALARALATSPGLLLLDEPLSALDALERVRLRQEIRALQRKLGVTTIMVTHDQEEALSVADRIVVMNHGVIEQVGTPMGIYRDPSTAFVADFVGRVNVLPAVVAGESRVTVGRGEFRCDAPFGAGAGAEVSLYIRPEDVIADFESAEGENSVAATIDKVEFLGSHCLVHAGCASLGGQTITAYLSPNLLAERGLMPGTPLRLRLLADRLRVF